MSDWISTNDRLPEKPGAKAYEYVWCIVFVCGEIRMLPWNCEHEVWDDEEMDDFKYHPKEVSHWMPLPAPPEATP